MKSTNLRYFARFNFVAQRSYSDLFNFFQAKHNVLKLSLANVFKSQNKKKREKTKLIEH